MTIEEFLDLLNGGGLIITDEDLLEEELKVCFNATFDTEIIIVK